MSLKFLKRDENLEKKQTKSSNGVFSQSFNPNGNCTIICKALVYFQDEGEVRLWGKKKRTPFHKLPFPSLNLI